MFNQIHRIRLMNTMEKCFVYIIWFYNLIHSLGDEEWCDIAIRIPDLWWYGKRETRRFQCRDRVMPVLLSCYSIVNHNCDENLIVVSSIYNIFYDDMCTSVYRHPVAPFWWIFKVCCRCQPPRIYVLKVIKDCQDCM